MYRISHDDGARTVVIAVGDWRRQTSAIDWNECVMMQAGACQQTV